jgi:hypothetical protein
MDNLGSFVVVMATGGIEMESVQNDGGNELYDVGDFGDARLKKRCHFVPAHGVPANSLFAATGGEPGAGSSIWSLAGE